MTPPVDAVIVLRLLLAALLASLIGLDRERLSWAAGLRTHMLVGVGAALFMIVSAYGFSDVLNRSNVVLDPSRVAAQVVSGIGFLGAGTILLRRDRIRGLTTAASLWSVAAIGLAVGGGLYVTAISATALLLLILAGIKPLEIRLRHHVHLVSSLDLTIDGTRVDLTTIEHALVHVGVMQIQFERGGAGSPDQVHVALEPTRQRTVLAAADALRGIDGVQSVRMTIEGADSGS